MMFLFLIRYTVMSGTPEKILEHFLETIRLEPALNEATGKYPERFCVSINSMQHIVKKKKNPEFILFMCNQNSFKRGLYILMLKEHP